MDALQACVPSPGKSESAFRCDARVLPDATGDRSAYHRRMPDSQTSTQPMVPLRDGRIVTETDHVRIFNLLQRESKRGAGHNAIVDLIDSAELVSPRNVPPDVVTMQSRVLVAPAVDGQTAGHDGAAAHRELTLCYPEDADPAAGKVSVLTPAGACLLGRKVGDVARWSIPDGDSGATRILAVLFQPEANGDYVA